MTVHGFKQLCMAANTENARKVRDYYIAMEEVMFEYTKRKMEQHATLLATAAIKDIETKRKLEQMYTMYEYQKMGIIEATELNIVKAFETIGLLNGGVSLNIQGTPDEPLFQASQVGALLGLTNIRETIRDFDEDEARVSLTDTSRSATFLTEIGLYRLLGMSRKPFARPFQKWVAKVVKEIRLTGKYELMRQLAEVEATHATVLATATQQLAIKNIEASEARHLAETKALELLRCEDELQRLKTKTYEEVPKLDHVYISKEVAELSSQTHKIGKAIDTKRRESQLNTGSAQGSRIIYERSTLNAKVVEDIVRVAQRRYHIGMLGGTEHYTNEIEHSVNVIDVACTVVDTLASTYEYITRNEMLNKLVAKIEDLRLQPFLGPRGVIRCCSQAISERMQGAWLHPPRRSYRTPPQFSDSFP